MAGSPRIIARPTTRSPAACRRARVRQGQAFGGAKEAPSLTAAARRRWKYAVGTEECSRRGSNKRMECKGRPKWRDAPLTMKAPYKPYVSQEEVLFQSRRVITGEGLTPGLGFQVATPNAIRDKRPELEDFLRRLTAARAWSLTNVSAYAESWGKLMSIPSAVPLNWLSRAKIRIAPIDDGVVADEQKPIDLYFRSGLIKQKLNAADIVDRSFSDAIGKAAGL